ncbi:hypothetical protein QBC39DRAFT_4213 [Podospora conica]|nr:hypothetical protein QBC39DRAFT_4213 [Schizothecium conicum]
MRAIKSPRLATHAVALQKQPGMQLSTCHPLDPFRLTHTTQTDTRTERENLAPDSRRRSMGGMEAKQFGLFIALLTPPFPARPVPATGTPRLSPALASFADDGPGTDMNRLNRQTRHLYLLDPTEPSRETEYHWNTPICLVRPTRPGWRRSITATGPGLDGAGPRCSVLCSKTGPLFASPIYPARESPEVRFASFLCPCSRSAACR